MGPNTQNRDLGHPARLVYFRTMAGEQEIVSDEEVSADVEIAPDESIGTGPEIEAVESPEAETEKEPDESAAAKGGKVEVGCLIEWSYRGPKCGRELHAAPDGVDEQPVCLMHSNDPGKQSGALFDAFWLEFERTLEAAGDAGLTSSALSFLNST
jgi:hypothetical protein